MSPYLGAIIASSEKKKFLRLVKAAYGRDVIYFQSRNLGDLGDLGGLANWGDLEDLEDLANLAFGAIAGSKFGLGYAEHELQVASSVKPTEIRH